MNRRSLLARMLGAACLAVAERMVPAALVKAEAPELVDDEPTSEWVITWSPVVAYALSDGTVRFLEPSP